jgi:histidinol dehydrogenase
MVTTSPSLADRVRDEVARQLAVLPREKIARASVGSNGRVFVVATRERAAELADMIAAEHLSLQVSQPEALLERIGAAGAAFLGPLTPEAAGDYVAGPSHVLPTGGSVRFGSPLGVYDFVTRTSLIGYTPSALQAQARSITALARIEGLEGHARAVEARIAPESVG